MSMAELPHTGKLNTSAGFEWCRADQIEMAPAHWGRAINPYYVRNIGLGFDPDKFGVIAVWRIHQPGKHARLIALDGQHRVRAVIDVLGWGDQKVPCMVFNDLTDAEAADISDGLQTRRNLAPYDKYRVELAAGDPRATQVQQAVDIVGLQITNTAGGVGQIRAIAALFAIYDRLGYEGLRRVLSLCHSAWPAESGAISSPALKMVAGVISAHPDVEDNRLSKTLMTQRSVAWTAPLKESKRNPVTIGHLCQEIATVYNKRLSERNKLDVLSPTGYATSLRRRPAPRSENAIPIKAERQTGGRSKAGLVRARKSTAARKARKITK